MGFNALTIERRRRLWFSPNARPPLYAHARGVDPISDALPFGRLWYAEPNAVSNATAGRNQLDKNRAP
jgi:hypothetical protein